MDTSRADWPGTASGGPSPSAIYQQTQQNQQHRNTGRARKKLRESCNNCALSKVKCSKEQPVCARCDEREMYCHYSPTRRTGKRRAWSQAPAETAGFSLKDITPPEEQNFFDYGFLLNQDLLSRGDPLEARNPDRSTSSQSLTSLMSPPLSLQLQSGKAISETQSQIHGTMFSPKRLDNNVFVESSSVGSGLGYFMDHPGDLTMTTGSFEDHEPLLDLINQESNFAMSTPTLNEGHRESKSGIKSEPPDDHPQHCMNLALETLQKLHSPPSHCNFIVESRRVTTLPPPAPSVDQIVSTNRASLDVVQEILRCPCSLDTQLAFLLTTITSKIISRYGAVAQNYEDQSVGPSSPRGTATSAAGSPDYVSNLPMAKYQDDGNSKGKMRAQLVLSELHLVLRLIDKLISRFKALLSVDEGCENVADPLASAVFVELESFLRQKLRMLAKETTEVLRAS